jgi:pimeloyl-ACP methyl ester carboxylesterase
MNARRHDTATTQFLETPVGRFAYRRLGSESGVPLLLLQHFRGNMDSWDPAVVDGLSETRPLILLDARGIGGSSPPSPDNVAEMAGDAVVFLDGLGLPEVDVLGFSLGGMVAQQLMFDRPGRVRRAILAGTGGPGATGMFGPGETRDATKMPGDPDSILSLFFRPTTTSQAAGERYLKRMLSRVDRVPATTEQALRAQLSAIRTWGATNGETFARLRDVVQPVLVVNGTHDVLIPTVNAYALSQQLPNAQLALYPDAGHGSLFQYPEWFVHDVSRFLDRN